MTQLIKKSYVNARRTRSAEMDSNATERINVLSPACAQDKEKLTAIKAQRSKALADALRFTHSLINLTQVKKIIRKLPA